ncbi:hypothetical protein ABEB36_002844 [Hypothenemus hampei]|uniref:Uncharacterized protein n=1 Tax=Hypothenemus hampei TaxID=57062 RepID=A0ABD1F780_HYPHA
MVKPPLAAVRTTNVIGWTVGTCARAVGVVIGVPGMLTTVLYYPRAGSVGGATASATFEDGSSRDAMSLVEQLLGADFRAEAAAAPGGNAGGLDQSDFMPLQAATTAPALIFDDLGMCAATDTLKEAVFSGGPLNRGESFVNNKRGHRPTKAKAGLDAIDVNNRRSTSEHRFLIYVCYCNFAFYCARFHVDLKV